MKRPLKDKTFMRIFLPLSIALHIIFIAAPLLSLFENSNQTDMTVVFHYDRDYKELPRVREISDEKLLKSQPENKEQKIDEHALTPDSVTEQHVDSDEDHEKLMMRYHDIIKQMIEEAREYPLIARQQKIEGIVNIRFLLNADGTVKSIEILNSSGRDILDTAAVRTIQKAAPFPEIPDTFERSTISLVTSIVYTLR